MPSQTDLSSLITTGVFFKHAVATPLSTLLLSLELANQASRSLPSQAAESLRHNLETSYLATQRLVKLFEFARQPNLSRQRVWLLSLMQELKLFCQTKFSGGQLIVSSQSTTDCSIYGNRFLILEALLCAVTNGFESYPSDAPNKVVSISWRQVHQKLQLHITDGGRGGLVPNSRYLRLGETSKNSHSGLGLTLIQAVVEQHLRGRLEVTSPRHFGTTLTLVLPLSEDVTEASSSL